MGQLLAHQDRGAVYLAAELIGLRRYPHLTSQVRGEARRYRALAFDVARRQFAPTPRDTVFEYYETMEHVTASGRYNLAPGPALVPETDLATFNGAVWLLARQTYWADPNTPPDPSTPAYMRALEFYQAHAVGPDFLWSWSNASLEQGVFREAIRKSDAAYRRAQNQLGLLLANHVLSAIDALISSRLAAAAGRSATLVVIGADGGKRGLGLCGRLKADSYAAIGPLAALGGRHATDQVEAWFAAGADEVITPLFEPAEQLSRLDGLLTRSSRDVAVNPSPPLPGTPGIEREIPRALEAGCPFGAGCA